MELKDVLTESELGNVPQNVVEKIESAYRAELATAVEAETKKTTARFNKLLESVRTKAEEKIDQAIMENVNKMKTNAMNDKMYKVLQAVAAVLESAGIPTSEVTKKLKEELAQCNVNLQKAYAEREHVKAQLNEQQKKTFIMSEVAGLKPELQDAVMQQFIRFDIREITHDAIVNFLNGNSSTTIYMMDVDPDAGGELDMDRVNASLDEIGRDIELDVPTLPSRSKNVPKKTGRFESLGQGLNQTRIGTCTPDVTFEALETMNTDMSEDSDDEGIAEAIKQFQSFGGQGFV